MPFFIPGKLLCFCVFLPIKLINTEKWDVTRWLDLSQDHIQE